MNARTLTAWAAGHKAQLRFALRITVASLATFAIGHLLGLTQAYWAVLTALIVSQASVGGSLRATRDRFVGSLGGAAWGVAVSLTLPHATLAGLALTLTAALAPLAMLTALNPAYRIAPVTAVILLLTPTGQSAGPFTTATHRMLEIGLGSVVALVVALLVLPERAHAALARAAADALESMARLVMLLLADPARPGDAGAAGELHAHIRKAILTAEAAADEVARERRTGLLAATDPDPLCRTLRRVHNDLIMLGRASQTPLPEPVRARLAGPAAKTAEALADAFRGVGEALVAGKVPPDKAALEQVLGAYAFAAAAARRDGLTRDLPDEAVGRIFSQGFALEQLRVNFGDLTQRAAELAKT
jgi:uncharacterized membrane protein YccC